METSQRLTVRQDDFLQGRTLPLASILARCAQMIVVVQGISDWVDKVSRPCMFFAYSW